MTSNKPLEVPAIAYRTWSKGVRILYVREIKGRKGDWGYTDTPSKASLISPWHQRRFAADCKFVGDTPYFQSF
jgi:hypothetical protein